MVVREAAALLLLISASLSFAQDARYCGEPARYSNGAIKRSQAVVREFERLYPLPASESRDNWQVDHVIPLVVGGCDSIINMQWLKKSIKTCPGTECKDRWEREIYAK